MMAVVRAAMTAVATMVAAASTKVAVTVVVTGGCGVSSSAAVSVKQSNHTHKCT